MRYWLVFDTETTELLLPESAPLDKQPKIIELAIVQLALASGGAEPQECGRHSWLINPGEPLTDEITKITGLTDADLKDAPPFAAVLPEIVRAFHQVHGLVAHNLPFDRGMLVNELRRCGREHSFPYPPDQLCTVDAFHGVKGRRMKMVELYEHVMGRPLAQTHRALDDAGALAEVLRAEKGRVLW